MLDVACGTGIVAWIAREVAPEVEWRQGNAASLPIGGEQRFDAVVCQQGFQFFDDAAAAARECGRVLARGGRVAASTWLPLAETPLFRNLSEVGERHLGAIADARFGLGDGETLGGLL